MTSYFLFLSLNKVTAYRKTNTQYIVRKVTAYCKLIAYRVHGSTAFTTNSLGQHVSSILNVNKVHGINMSLIARDEDLCYFCFSLVIPGYSRSAKCCANSYHCKMLFKCILHKCSNGAHVFYIRVQKAQTTSVHYKSVSEELIAFSNVRGFFPCEFKISCELRQKLHRFPKLAGSPLACQGCSQAVKMTNFDQKLKITRLLF